MMNGVASAAMRSSADYRVNFGVELPRLSDMAAGISQDKDVTYLHSLAQELWKENVRECRILATMLEPTDVFDEELCDIWVSQIHTAELAQIAALHLFSRLPYALPKSLEWIADSEGQMVTRSICGFTTLLHLNRCIPLDTRTIHEVDDQASAIVTDNLFLKKLIYQWTNIPRQ